MKKMILAVIMFMLLIGYASAESEILFQNIEWLADEKEAVHALKDSGFIRDDAIVNSFNIEKPTYIIENDMGFISPDYIIGVEDVSFALDLSGFVKGKIAGYPIKNLTLSFAYDGSYKLIAIKVELIKADYDTLKEKLNKAYGEGEVKIIEEEGISTIVWRGDNNSSVILYTQSEGYDYTFMYGRLDAVEILSKCLASPDPDDISGL